MTAILTRDQIRSYDGHAIDRCSVPGVVLMENAGRGAAEVIVALLSELGRSPLGTARPSSLASAGSPLGPTVIVCGPGNNGGDGFVVARHLMARGYVVEVFLAGDPAKVQGDAKVNLEAFVGVGGELCALSADALELGRLRAALDGACLAVDALFGTGLDRRIEGPRREVIEIINDAACPTVALDIPSGIDADQGQVLGVAVRAEHTVTFAHPKAGLYTGPGADCAGRIHVAGLGLPDGLILDELGVLARLIEPDAVAAWLGHRRADAHKYQAGSVLVIAGSPGKVGAALLCGRAALRAGAGIVTIGTWPRAADAIDQQAAEVMTARLEPDRLEASLAAALVKRNAVAIGPGLGLDDDARALVDRIVLGFEGPAVVDADAITLLAGQAERLRQAVGPRVLTPHAGELARLMGTSAAEVEEDRFAAAREAASRTGQTIVLKGRHSIVAAPGHPMWLSTRGNAALATAGSGDVLTGMLGALLCVAEPVSAAAAAVFLHGAAADAWRAEAGADRGMVAGDIIARLPAAIADVQR